MIGYPACSRVIHLVIRPKVATPFGKAGSLTITPGKRIWAALGYTGAVSVLWFIPAVRRDEFLRHHARQALGVTALGLLLLGAFLVAVAVFSYWLVQDRAVYEEYHGEAWLLFVFRKLALAWAVFPAFGALTALAARRWYLPGATCLGECRACRRATAILALTLAIAFLAAGGVGLYTAWITPAQGEVPVYVLYDNALDFPRPLFALGFRPLLRAGETAHGKGQVVLAPLTEASLVEALQHGRFIFLGAHGKARGLLLEGQWFPPARAAAMTKNPDLAYVYLASCDGGAQADSWRDALAPAEVHTFNRLSAVAEHLLWIWLRGPGIVRATALETP